jgi:AraC family transcriptional regulator
MQLSESIDHSTAAVSVRQLRSVVSELYTALSSTLQDERANAQESLKRAAAILESVDGEAPEAAPPTTGIPALQSGLAPWQIRRVMAHIEVNLESSIRNDDLAAVARLSTFHFCRAFRNSVGVTPHEYVIRRRIERAQGLMLSTDASLSQIAADCGLADQAHLTRLFRRALGESPSAWRKARAIPPP